MIYLVDGTPGAGKSYFAVKAIADAVAAGKVVTTNVPLKPDFGERVAAVHPIRRHRPAALHRKALEYRSRVLVSQDLQELFRVRVLGDQEGRAVMVLDEAHRWLNSRNWSQGERGSVIEWFTAHRHYGFDVYLITQHIDSIDKQVRNLVSHRVRLRNLRRDKRLAVRLLVRTNVFVAVHELQEAKDKPIVGRDWYLLNKSLAGMYNTHGLAREDQVDDVIWLPRIPVPEAGGAADVGGPPVPPLSIDGHDQVKDADRGWSPVPVTAVASAESSLRVVGPEADRVTENPHPPLSASSSSAAPSKLRRVASWSRPLDEQKARVTGPLAVTPRAVSRDDQDRS